MTAFDRDPALKWLFCMTHPDDEISICAWMHELVENGNEVWISWTHDTPVRRLEAIRAAAYLGVPEQRLKFFSAPDGAVCRHLEELEPRFREMMGEVRPDRVVCGAFEQGHLDHDATNFLVNRTFDGAVFEVPFYHTYRTKFPRVNRFADPTGEEVNRLTVDQITIKKAVCRMYPSQRIWWNMVGANLRAIATGDGNLLRTERMRRQTWQDFLTPNLPQGLAKAVELTGRWQEWIKNAGARLG